MALIFANEENFIWIEQPMPFERTFKLNGTDITTDVIEAEISRVATTSVGTFKAVLNNNDGAYEGVDGNETFEFFADFVDGTTRKFHGKVERAVKSTTEGHNITLEGVHISHPILDTMVTVSHSGASASDVVKSLIDSMSGFTYDNVEDVDVEISVNWTNKPIIDCLIDVCIIADCDYYVDDDGDFHFFVKGSKLNTSDAAVGTTEGNLIQFDSFGVNIADVKNKVTAYGEDNEGLTIIATSEDSESQNKNEVREHRIYDTSMDTYEEAVARASAHIVQNKDPNTTGTTQTLWLLNINPGEKMWVSVPEREIHDKYIIRKINYFYPSHNCTCEIYKETKGIAQIFKDNMQKGMAIEKIINPFDMRYSYNFTFDNDTNLAHAGTYTSDGSLLGAGTCTSSSRETTNNVVKVQLKVIGQDVGVSTFEVSVDDGDTWETVNLNEEFVVGSTGNHLAWRVTLTSDSDNTYPKIDSLSLLYK
jgi:hypothetical protein